EQIGDDGVGEADAAGFGESGGELLRLHAAPGLLGKAAAEGVAVAFEGGEYFLHQGVEENPLKFLRLLADAGWWGQRSGARGADPDGVHQSTSLAACTAPGALLACRMAIRSRGLMPSAFSPSTSCCSVTDSGTTARLLSVLETVRS